jgi:hypothetical protein
VGLIIEADGDLEVENFEFLMGRIGRPMRIVLRIKASEVIDPQNFNLTLN